MAPLPVFLQRTPARDPMYTRVLHRPTNQRTNVYEDSPETNNQGTNVYKDSPETNNQRTNVYKGSPETNNQGTNVYKGSPETNNQGTNVHKGSPETNNQGTMIIYVREQLVLWLNGLWRTHTGPTRTDGPMV